MLRYNYIFCSSNFVTLTQRVSETVLATAASRLWTTLTVWEMYVALQLTNRQNSNPLYLDKRVKLFFSSCQNELPLSCQNELLLSCQNELPLSCQNSEVPTPQMNNHVVCPVSLNVGVCI